MRTTLILISSLAAACSAPKHAESPSSSSSSGEVPAAVRARVAELLGAKAARHIDVEGPAAAPVYEAGRKTKIEVEVDGAGGLLATEVELPVAALPTAVAVAAAAQGRVVEADLIVTASGVMFEVEIDGAGGRHELTLDLAGAVVQQGDGDEHEGDDADDDDDDGDDDRGDHDD